jgi:hypothetical protein
MGAVRELRLKLGQKFASTLKTGILIEDKGYFGKVFIEIDH